MSGCSSPEQFERLLEGQLSEAETQALEAHVEACPHCQEKLARVVASTEGADWKLLPRPSPGFTDGSDADFLRYLGENPPTTPKPGSSHRDGSESSTIQFPGPPTPKGPLGQLESYHIRKQLGQGTFGVVYQAYDALDRLVAIKVLKPEFAASPKECARFTEEARAGAAVKHDHVVTIYQIGDPRDYPFPYLVMEYVEGEALSDQLRRKELLPPEEVARLVRQVALGLGAAHQQGLLHRDIKPSNILVEKATRRAKIADFGLACALEETTARISQSERLAGTLAYMCPEQIVPPHHLDQRSDVYSLGVVLYELLTGVRPFQGVKDRVLEQVVHDDPRPPRKLNDHVPRDLETITLKCLAKEPGRRYQTAQELADDLQRWLDGVPIQARPVSGWERAVKWAKRRPDIAALAAMVIVVTALGFGLVLKQWLRAEDHKTQAQAAARKAEEQKENAERLQREAEEQEKAAEELRRWAQALSTKLSQDLFEQGHVGRGMIMIAHSLEAAAGDKDLQQPILVDLASRHHELGRLTNIIQHPGSVNAVAFSRDGRTILTGCGDFEKGTGKAQLWDAATGDSKGPPLEHGAPVLSLAFSDDSERIITGDEGGKAQLWDVATGQPLGKLLEQRAGITAVAFSPDGKTVLTGSATGFAWLWDVATGRHCGEQLKVGSKVTAVAFSPDGRTVLTGSLAGNAQLWEVPTGKHGRTWKHQAPVHAVAFCPDGRTILTGGRGIRRWDLTTGEPLGRPVGQELIRAVAFRSDGFFLTASYTYSQQNHLIERWGLDPLRPIGQPVRYYGSTQAMAFGPDGKTILAGSLDGMARLYSIPPSGFEGNRPSKTLDHESGLNAVAFSHNGKSVLTGCADGNAQLWDATTGKPIGPLLEHPDEVRAVAFSPDNQTILTGSKDCFARLWKAATGEPIKPSLEHPGDVWAVAFSPDGQTILTGCGDGKARLWDAATGKLRGELIRHHRAVYAVAFSPDGKTALTAGQDRTARLWDAHTGKLLDTSFHHGIRIQSVAFSPDGKTALTGGFDSIVRQWDVATGKPREPALLDRASVHAVAFSPDGRTILTGNVNHQARLWDAATGQPIGMPFRHNGSVRAVAFSPDGQSILTGSWIEGKTYARLWQVPVPLKANTKDDVKRIVLWIQVVTGMEVDSAGAVRALGAKQWQERRERLKDLGGPPVP